MKRIPLTRGRIALSLAGRDEGRLFVVISELDDDFVEIADGDLRKIEKPKKKRRKHLKATTEQIESMQEGVAPANFELRKALAAYQPSEEG